MEEARQGGTNLVNNETKECVMNCDMRTFLFFSLSFLFLLFYF